MLNNRRDGPVLRSVGGFADQIFIGAGSCEAGPPLFAHTGELRLRDAEELVGCALGVQEAFVEATVLDTVYRAELPTVGVGATIASANTEALRSDWTD